MTGSELRRRRQDRGWSQRDLAKRAGIHHRTVQYWEARAKLDPLGDGVKRMAEALGWRLSPPLRAHAGWGLTPDEELDVIVDALDAMPQRLATKVMFIRVRCGAKTRKGTPCRAMSEPNRHRCRFHGGKSTGPKTAEGRERIAEAQRRRWAKYRERKSSGSAGL